MSSKSSTTCTSISIPHLLRCLCKSKFSAIIIHSPTKIPTNIPNNHIKKLFTHHTNHTSHQIFSLNWKILSFSTFFRLFFNSVSFSWSPISSNSSSNLSKKSETFPFSNCIFNLEASANVLCILLRIFRPLYLNLL